MMSSTFMYIVLTILFMIYIRLKLIRIQTVLDIVALFAIFQLFMTWFALVTARMS